MYTIFFRVFFLFLFYMEITIYSLLSLLALLFISSVIYVLSKKIKLPYTVLLVIAGLLLVPISQLPFFSFISTFKLTPELLFYVFLPALIFESAFNMDIRHLVRNIRSISLLAVAGLLISTFFVGFAIYYIFPFLGYGVPLMVAMLFAALISSTDPVAVLALFKEYGAPKRLSLIFEGESLLNDGTAVAIFLIMLQIAQKGFEGVSTVGHGIFMFFTMVVGGIAIGLFLGGLFSKAIGYAKSHQSISIALTIVAAHLTFILTEFISAHLVLGGTEIKFSSIIATMTASMVIGNYGRHKIGVRAQEFVDKFWAEIAFLANSVVFLLIGLLFVDLPFSFTAFLVPIIGAILIVAIGRAISVYLPVGLLNWTKTEEHIPQSWQQLLAWGSLRGALALTLVLIIPDDLVFAGWDHAFTPKEFIMALTIGCIYATLFIKAVSIGPLIKRLNISALTAIENREYAQSRALIHANVLKRLQSFWEKGYIDSATYNRLNDKHKKLYDQHIDSCVKNDESVLSERVLLIHTLGIEKHFLRELFAYGEVTEKVFKRILGKLTIQYEHIESGEGILDSSIESDSKDVFEALARMVRFVISPKSRKDTIEEQFMYYRAQTIIARKVLKELDELTKTFDKRIFGEGALGLVIERYKQYRERSQQKMEHVSEENKEIIHALHERLAASSIYKIEETVLEELKKRDMVTQKLYITLRDEFEVENSI